VAGSTAATHQCEHGPSLALMGLSAGHPSVSMLVDCATLQSEFDKADVSHICSKGWRVQQG
jgi:hypothetical protein